MRKLLTGQHGITTVFIVIIVALCVIVVGVVGSAAVILSNDVTITVNNRSCGTLDVAKGAAALKFNFLPGIEVPSEIAQGETAQVQLPKNFVDSVTIATGSVEVRAFSQSFTFGTSDIDMQRSTWDGKPLSELVGQEIKISGDHTLVLECG